MMWIIMLIQVLVVFDELLLPIAMVMLAASPSPPAADSSC